MLRPFGCGEHSKYMRHCFTMLRLQFFHKAFPRSFGCKPVSKATRKTCAGVPLGGGGPYVQNARASGKIFLKQASPPSEMGQKFKKSEKTFRIFREGCPAGQPVVR